VSESTCTDNDSDGIQNDSDNCPADPNPDQSDVDGDTLGDACDDDDDDDGLSDADEAILGCTDPLDSDSDGDGLYDGAERYDLGTNPCLADTDGDGLSDAVDPRPLEPDVGSSLVERLDALSATIAAVPLASHGVPLWTGFNARVNAAYRALLSSLAWVAARAAERGAYGGVVVVLRTIIVRVDLSRAQPDWMTPSTAQAAILTEAQSLVALASRAGD
jgi:hypothetical protein